MPIKLRPVLPLIILILVLVSSAGCLGSRTPAVNKTPPPAMIVDYHRSGGIAGLDDRLVIFDNGVAVISGKSASTEISLTATDMALIAVLFNQSDFSQLQPSYSAPSGSADVITYTLSYHGKTVTAAETSVPPSLKVVIDQLNRILSRAEPQKLSYPTIGITP